jgi:hypothetical protein
MREIYSEGDGFGRISVAVKESGGEPNFRVSYGKQVRDFDTYKGAAADLGYALFHHLACDGLINNEGEG